MTEKKWPRDIIEANLLACGIGESVVEEFTSALDPTFNSDVFHMVWNTCQEVDKYIARADIPTQWHDAYHCMVTLGQAEVFDAPSTNRRSVIHGNISDHPLYSTVAYQASWLDEQYRFFYVNLQFLAVCATITARKVKGEVSDHALRQTCLLTRQFNEGKINSPAASCLA
jgi:hypothetical protein